MEIFVTPKKYNHQRPIPLKLLATLSINGMLLMIFFADITTWMYQEIYFSIMEIPKIPRSKFVTMQRHKLPGLSFFQKWSCWYCEYTNSVVAWAKEVANQTELYSCSIKYTHQYPGQEYQKDFYEQAKFKE